MSALSELIVQVNNSTNKVAVKLQRLIDKLAEEQQVDQADIDALTSIRDSLEAMGADEENPFPTE